ncbi:MAG TPA: type I-E CRISPR-associated protein Cse1/CasA [Candidatus Competibacteraceae bacterium]|nr:type I-E CRISPR-associated protein Cse1/CasA [Candidatus Competibacteraceae bacterium]HPF59015.1 type I-E CRISPR-associated protein Cse1/CasA [Candidatus Competibacteraceae bacterium]
MNLLTGPLFRVQTTTGPQAMNLPGLLAALGADTVGSLPGLQRHQEDAFHIFLCYLAGAVLARAGIQEPVQPEAFWRAGLRQLAGRDDDCAWVLMVEDVTKPAFMQVPLVNKAHWAAFKPKADTPDALDVLQTAKNHDVKSQRVHEDHPERWVYALISLQTMTGLMGRGNYGIARMNSGTGSRVCVGLRYDETLGGRWRRETRKLLYYRAELLVSPWPYRPDGLVLLWLPPWDLQTALPLTRLDPFFIEVARAVRLTVDHGRVQALGAGTAGNRIAAKAQKGIVGDPWTPLVDDGKEKKAWTVMAPFFSPQRLRNLIFEKEGFTAAAMQQPDPDRTTQACWVQAAVLAPGGMGKTDGFHEATVRIPARAARCLFGGGAAHERLAELSGFGLNDAAAMQNKVLKPALYAWLEAGPEQIDWDKREVSAWVEQTARSFAAIWHTVFFDWLWNSIDQAGTDAARCVWLQTLERHARETLAGAMARFPVRMGRYYRSRVRANSVFSGCLFKIFPELKEIADARRRTVTDAACP